MGHKSSLGKFKKTEIISGIFSDHNAMRLDINYRKKPVKNTSTWRLNNTLLNNQEITEEMKGNKNIPRNKWQWKHDDPKPMDAAKAVLRGKFTAIKSYLKKQETSQINNLTLHLKELEKEEQKKPQS